MFKKIYSLFLLLIMLSTIHAFQARNVKFISINTTIPLKIQDSNTSLFIDRALSGALTDLARINSNAKWSFTLKVSPRNKVQNAIKKGVMMTSNNFANEVDADIVITRSVTEIVDGVYDVSLIIESNREQLSSQNSKIISAKGVSKSEQGRNLRLELLNHLVGQLNDMYPNENSLSKKEYSEAAIKKFGPKPSINDLGGTVNRNSKKEIKIVIPTSEESVKFNLVSQPENGVASLSGNTVSYLPNEGFAGKENLKYLSKNENGMFSIASIEIKVINNSPKTKNISLNVEAGESLSIDLSKYASDINGDRLNYTLLETSSSLSGTISSKGSKIVYNSNPNFSGKENLSFFASDDLGAKSNISNINIITLENSKKKAEAARKAAALEAARSASEKAAALEAARLASEKAAQEAARSASEKAAREAAAADRKKAQADRKKAEEELAEQRAREDLAFQKAEEARKKAEEARKKSDRESGLVGSNIENDSTEVSENISGSSDSEQEDGGMNLTVILGGVLLLALLAGGGGGGGGGGGIATGTIDIGILLP